MKNQNNRGNLPLLAHLLVMTPLVAVLAGCVAGPNYKQPAQPSATGYTSSAPPAVTVASPGVHGGQQQFMTAPVPTEWWKELHADKLTRLIDQALASSPTLVAAQATMRQAEQSYAALSGSTQLPQANAKIGGQRQGVNNTAAGLPDGERTYSLYSASVSVSYDLDLAGGNRRALEALEAQVDYQSYQLEGARLALAANIVQTAITQAQLTSQIDATEKLLQAQVAQLTLTQKRLELGVATQLEVLALQTLAQQTQAGLPVLRNKREQTRHLLAVLAGQAPSDANVPSFEMADFSLPTVLPISVPSELVRRRPDIRASEALLQAAGAQYGVTLAKQYPQITLSANLGSQALTIASLFGAGSMIWSLGGQLVQPLFNPSLKANTKAAEAGLVAAEANYKQTVLQSMRNVADVLRTIESDAQVQQSLENATASAHESLGLAERQYASGTASYLQVLQSQQQAQQTLVSTLELRARRLANTVALYQAMGGSWEESAKHVYGQ